MYLRKIREIWCGYFKVIRDSATPLPTPAPIQCYNFQTKELCIIRSRYHRFDSNFTSLNGLIFYLPVRVLFAYSGNSWAS